MAKTDQRTFEGPVMEGFFAVNDVILVMGRRDQRSEFVPTFTSEGKETERIRQRLDLAKRHFITRAKSPVGNQFEREKGLSRKEQIDAHREYVFEHWILKNDLPADVAEWVDARIKEIEDGTKIDLISDSREYACRPGMWLAKAAPHDCHGHTIRGVILWRAGQIKSSEFVESILSYRDSKEGPGVKALANWRKASEE